MPVRQVSAHLFQTFHPHHLPADWSVCRPKSPPVQRAQWSLFWVAKLSGLIAPIGPTSFPDRGECLDRQILVAKHVKTGVCAIRRHTGVQTRTRTHTHTHPQALRGFIRVHCFQHRGCWGKILAVTPHAHWGALMGPTQRRGWDGNTGSVDPHLITGCVYVNNKE